MFMLDWRSRPKMTEMKSKSRLPIQELAFPKVIWSTFLSGSTGWKTVKTGIKQAQEWDYTLLKDMSSCTMEGF